MRLSARLLLECSRCHFTSVLIKSSNFNGTYSRKDFQSYTGMEPQTFKERILDDFDFIQKYMIESILHNKEIEQRMNAKKLQIQECKVPYTAEYNVFVVETRHFEQPENMNDTSLMEKVDSNTTPDSSDLCNNEFKDDQNADDREDERVLLANLIANLKLDIDENKKIQKQLRNANAALTHELKKCKSALEESKAFEIDA
ncbi:hypothetical protein Tco_1331705 [Tanacetum coccineum]